MRTLFRVVATLVLLAALPMAGSDSPAELKARADAAHGADQAKLCLEYAHHQLEDADNQFSKGDIDKAQAEIQEVLEYSQKATDAATSSGKHLKQTEIELRKLSKRMHDIGETLAFDDRGSVQKAVDAIEQLRSDLLAKMWGLPEAKGKS